MTSNTPQAVDPAAVQGSRRRGGSRSRTFHSRRKSMPLTLMMLAALVYFALPLFWLVVSSTKSYSALLDSFGLWFAGGFHLFDNIHDVFTVNHGEYARWLLNSAIYSGVSAGGASVLAALAGYALAKLHFPGRNAMFLIVLGAIMVPSTALAIPTYLIFSHIGLTDSPIGVILPGLVSPFGFYLMKVYADDAIPDSLLEAARIDGAGEFRIFRSIAFVQMAPGFVTVLLFTLVSSWNNYFLPFILLSTPKYYPLTVGLTNWGGAYSLVVTGSLIAVVPIIVAFYMLQRYWESGLGLGAVKG